MSMGQQLRFGCNLYIVPFLLLITKQPLFHYKIEDSKNTVRKGKYTRNVILGKYCLHVLSKGTALHKAVSC